MRRGTFNNSRYWAATNEERSPDYTEPRKWVPNIPRPYPRPAEWSPGKLIATLPSVIADVRTGSGPERTVHGQVSGSPGDPELAVIDPGSLKIADRRIRKGYGRAPFSAQLAKALIGRRLAAWCLARECTGPFCSRLSGICTKK